MEVDLESITRCLLVFLALPNRVRHNMKKISCFLGRRRVVSGRGSWRQVDMITRSVGWGNQDRFGFKAVDYGLLGSVRWGQMITEIWLALGLS
jgi:hypothetical protein